MSLRITTSTLSVESGQAHHGRHRDGGRHRHRQPESGRTRYVHLEDRLAVLLSGVYRPPDSSTGYDEPGVGVASMVSASGVQLSRSMSAVLVLTSQ